MEPSKTYLKQLMLFLIVLISVTGCTTRAIDYDQVGPEDKLIIRFSHVTGEDTPKGLAANRFKELVEKRSNGKVEVQVFPNSTLLSDEEELEELKRGGVQIIAPAISKLSHIIPEVQYFDLPYIFNSQEEVWQAVEGPIGQEISQLLELEGYRLLAVWDNSFKQITNNEKPIREPQDFKDLHFRIMDSRALAKQFEVVGAKSTVVPFHQLYTSLEKGQVQGEENTLSNIYNRKLYKTQKYITKSDHGYLGYLVLTNQEFWDPIPDDIKKMLEQTLQEVTEWERNLAIKINEEHYQHIKQQPGVEVIELSPKEKQQWKEAFHSTYGWYSDNIRQINMGEEE